jgi:hypothetical protein
MSRQTYGRKPQCKCACISYQLMNTESMLKTLGINGLWTFPIVQYSKGSDTRANPTHWTSDWG